MNETKEEETVVETIRKNLSWCVVPLFLWNAWLTFAFTTQETSTAGATAPVLDSLFDGKLKYDGEDIIVSGGHLRVQESNLYVASPTRTVGMGNLVVGQGNDISQAVNSFVTGHANTAIGVEVSLLGGVSQVVSGTFSAEVAVSSLFDDKVTYDGTDIVISGLDVRVEEGNLRVGSPTFGAGHGNLVVGSGHNISLAINSFVAGHGNRVEGFENALLGGSSNVASGTFATVTGGRGNAASGRWSTVSGGQGNEASGDYGHVSGGYQNAATGQHTAVAGGQENVAFGDSATVAGGVQSKANGYYSSVTGGRESVASQDDQVAGPRSAVSSDDKASSSGSGAPAPPAPVAGESTEGAQRRPSLAAPARARASSEQLRGASDLGSAWTKDGRPPQQV